jgi:hypothetical protein
MASIRFPCHLRYPHFTRLPLALEIALALLIKILILILLWHAFFSTPQTKKMRMPTPQVEQHLLTPPAIAATPNTAAPVSSSTPRAHDDTHR